MMKNTNPPDLSPDDIRRIREGLGLTQVEAGELLGGGPRAFTKYENGTIKPTASVANLLKVLEKAPDELKTLTGRKAPPLDTAGHRPLEVSADHIGVLSPKKFTLLIERLLAAEAHSAGLPMDGIHVAARITVGDGGEDARIEWSGGPSQTPFIPARLTQYQLKATSVTPAVAGRDVLTPSGDVKPMVEKVLADGGNYVMLVARPSVKQTMSKHEAAIRKSLSDKDISFRDEQIAVRDAAQIALWVSTHPSVAAWVLEQTQPGLAGPFRDWSHWAGRHEHDSSPWVDDIRLNIFRAEVRNLVRSPRGIARVVGSSGVGKSRLTLEALGPDEAEEASRITLASLVLYAVVSEAGSQAITSSVQNLADAGIRAIVVIDRCDSETHENLAGIIKRVGSHLSLITIDHEFEEDSLPPGTLMVEPASKAVIEGIIRNAVPGMNTAEHDRLVRFAAGYPQAARLIAEFWEEPLIAANNDALIDRVIVGRRATNKEQLLKASMLLSVFGLIGIKSPIDADIEQVATLPGAPTLNELRGSFEDLLRRGVVQARGRLISLQPAPLTMPLALRQWRQWNSKTWDFVLAGFPNTRLRIRAAQQLALLNREKLATDIVQWVCRQNGPLGTIQAIKQEGTASILSSLAEIDAEAVVRLLEHLLDPLSLDDIKELKGDTRRHLVWALEKIAFREDTFEQGARLMLALAAAENENFGNNASGEFKRLFSVLDGNTAAGAEARLRMLDEIIAGGRGELLIFVAEALLQGINCRGNSRVVGAEQHGSRPALQPWRPRFWNDAWNYMRECLTRLANLANRNDAVGEKAKSGLGYEFRTLVSCGLLDDVEKVFETVVSQSGNYWPEALGTLGDIFVYDADALKEDEERRVRAIIARLIPTDLASRVRLLVTEMPWDYPVDEKLEPDERTQRQESDVVALAVELLRTPQELQQLLPGLSRGNHRMAGAFGRAIAQEAENPLAWFDPICAAYSAAPRDEADFGLLGGYMAGLAQREPAAVDPFKQMAVTSAAFAPALPFICSCVGLTETDVSLVVTALTAGFLQPGLLRQWMFGGQIARLPSASLAPLLDMLFNMDGDTYFVALDLLGMHVFGDRTRLDELRPQLRLAAAKVSQPSGQPRSRMNHHFKQAMEWILAKGRTDADAAAIAAILAKQIVVAEEKPSRDLIEPLLPQMLRDFPEIVWPIIGHAIVSNRKEAWRMEDVLGDTFSFQAKRPAILELPEEVLFAWCHTHTETAPAFVAGLLPILTSRDLNDKNRTLHPRTKRLLDEFGDRNDVLEALWRNIHTYGWSGSRADYYALYDGPLHQLETHPHGALRRWAKKTRIQLHRDIDNVHVEEDERDANWGM